jgi:hypothetical protein
MKETSQKHVQKNNISALTRHFQQIFFQFLLIFEESKIVLRSALLRRIIFTEDKSKQFVNTG